MPLLHNYECRGMTWLQHGIRKHQVLDLNRKIGEVSTVLWDFARTIIDKASAEGILRDQS
jgi:putative hydrolases of HD superfamily